MTALLNQDRTFESRQLVDEFVNTQTFRIVKEVFSDEEMNYMIVSGKAHKSYLPCFADANGRTKVGSIVATFYTVNQDADQWHVLYAWRHDGTLYTVSQHVAAPLTYERVRADLRRILANLVRVSPGG